MIKENKRLYLHSALKPGWKGGLQAMFPAMAQRPMVKDWTLVRMRVSWTVKNFGVRWYSLRGSLDNL